MVGLDLLRLLHVVLLLAGLAMGLATPARADSALTNQGLAAFSSGRYAEALQDWQRAAETGDGQAALYIGLLHDLGHGVVQDAQAAHSWYERAAALGNPVAMFMSACSTIPVLASRATAPWRPNGTRRRPPWGWRGRPTPSA